MERKSIEITMNPEPAILVGSSSVTYPSRRASCRLVRSDHYEYIAVGGLAGCDALMIDVMMFQAVSQS